MKLLMVALSVAVAYARPDISLVPSGSYLPGVGSGGVTSGGSFISSGVGGLDGLGGFAGLGGGSVGGGNFFGSNLLSGGSLGGDFLGGHGAGGAGGLAHEHKQVHFYAAPDEYHDRLRIYVAPSAQRNSRVIFVKAPSYGALRPEVIAPTSVTEDRTKVYVLVKKPENGGSITIPSTIASRPTKPEVFFVNYKTEQEAQLALAGGLQEEAVGPSAPELGNAQSFVKSLRADSTLGGVSGGNGGFVVGNGGFVGGFGGFGGVVGGGVGGVSGISSYDVSGSSLLGGAAGGHLDGAISGGVVGHGPVGASGPY